MPVKTPTPQIAVIGMGCWYPGARDLKQLWENILAKRQEFRQPPKQRLPLSDYYDADPSVPDKTYGKRMAVIDGFQFDWASKRIPKTVVETADIAHWVALDVAIKALEDAGYNYDNAPKERTGVIVGNSLTGEQTRSNNMRLRWPFVQRTLYAAAAAKGLSASVTQELARQMEKYYKSVFAPFTEDTLSGNLSNTIAGRICNFFNFHGGGYTVDGACSSSLIAVATAANALNQEDLDLALVGGVDISLDTFELVGFAKVGALTSKDMMVYDQKASGFIPGEGSGFVVLKRLEEARADHNYIYAILNGWGISSDGKGGLTAPNREGQVRALKRAYQKAKYSIGDLNFIEGHGTGTTVGDKIELEAIALAMESEAVQPRSCGVTSFKSLVGHTKAASGIGALIKTVIAVNRRIIPPLAGCQDPHEIFQTTAQCLYPVLQGEICHPEKIIRAGVSGMGFGGINCHITLESGDAAAQRLEPTLQERSLLVSSQDSEIFVLSASSLEVLQEQSQQLSQQAEGISVGELVDLAAYLARHLEPKQPVRAALIAHSPDELLERLNFLQDLLKQNTPQTGEQLLIPHQGIWIGNNIQKKRIGFLFPGQGSQKLNMARTLIERYDWARQLVQQADQWLEEFGAEPVSPFIYRPLDRAIHPEKREEWSKILTKTEIAQPAICLASLLWLRYLQHLGLQPVAVGGHSLGELTAFQAAGAFDEKTLLCLAALRGRAMSTSNSYIKGAMVSVNGSRTQAEALLKQVKGYAVIANINSPNQTVISGEVASIEEVMQLATVQEIDTYKLPVSHGFHSQLVESAAEQMRQSDLITQELHQINIELFSSLDGRQMSTGLSLSDHFAHQVLSQVDFISLVKSLQQKCDLLVEVGPGKVLSGLVSDIIGTNELISMPVEAKAEQARSLNILLATTFVQGSNINWEELYKERLVRPFIPASERIFIENPVEKPLEGTITSSLDLNQFLLVPSEQIKPEILKNYLAQRGQFITGVIQADLQTLPLLKTSPVRVATNGAPSQRSPETVTQKSPEALITDLIVKLTGYAKESISAELRLLDDLNLDSIKAGEVVAEVAKQYGVAGRIDPPSLANAKIQEIAETIRSVMPENKNLAVTTKEDTPQSSHGRSVSFPVPILHQELQRQQLVRNYIIQNIPEAIPSNVLGKQLEENWQTANILLLFEESNTNNVAALTEQLLRQGAIVQSVSFMAASSLSLTDSIGFTHFIAFLPCTGTKEESDDARLISMIERLRSVATPPPAHSANREHTTVAYIQFSGGTFGSQIPFPEIEQGCAMGFAASLHLERTDLKVRVIDFAPTVAAMDLAECVFRELTTAHVYTTVGYDRQLTRLVPRPQVQDPIDDQKRAIAWSAKDVILVTGGGKGITAECAFALARQTGAKIAIVGRSAPSETQNGSELSQTLLNFQSSGLTCRYYRFDVTDSDGVISLIQQVRQDLGEITGVIHGAALNKPRLVEQALIGAVFDEISPKLIGLINLCQALKNTPLKLLAGFSSVIGFTGMQRNAWYGFSNETLDLILRRFQAQHPETAVISMAYSVWDEVGMGARMGSVRSLSKMGISAIPKEDGIRRFLHLVDHQPADLRVVIAAPMQTLAAFESSGFDTWYPGLFSPPKSSKFLEKILIYQPGVEVILRVHLNLEQDVYLKDHLYKGSYLFPTVFGLEAMAQAVAYVTGLTSFGAVRIEDIRLERPIVVPPDQGVNIEIHAEVLERQSKEALPRVYVTIKTEQTGFAISHFSAMFVLGLENNPPTETIELPETALAIKPEVDLYSWLLFQGPSFQRLQKVYHLHAQKCVFQTQRNISLDGSLHRGQGPFLLGDPYCRDSLLQAGQLMIPQDLCLPIGIGILEIYPSTEETTESLIGVTTSDSKKEQMYSNTVSLLNEAGQVIERLNHYRLKILEHRAENPTAQELANPSQRDELILRRELGNRAPLFKVVAPEIALDYLPGLHAQAPSDRRQQEQPLFQKVIAKLLNLESTAKIQIKWTESGKPFVVGSTEENLDVSLSHDDQICLCVAGRGLQGCDIEPIQERTFEDWTALLSNERSSLLMQLQNSKDTLDRAGTRVWTALEAFHKASKAKEIHLAIERSEGDSVLFTDTASSHEISVLTFPVKLTRHPERMIALVVIPFRALDWLASSI